MRNRITAIQYERKRREFEPEKIAYNFIKDYLAPPKRAIAVHSQEISEFDNFDYDA